MSARATRKRARTSLNDTSDVQEDTTQVHPAPRSLRKRDEEFWCSDGNIILVAGDVEFRVYKGILSEHSPVFRDMFSLPQPPVVASSPSSSDDDSTCPVVHLSDSSEDLRHVLRAYMPRSDPSVFFPTAPTYSYEMVSAAVRLGHKYQMAPLLDRAISYLKRYYTDDFATWESYNDYGPPGFSCWQHAIGVVNLARLTGETSILPTALLICCMVGSDLVHGFTNADGTQERLSSHDLALCVAAKDVLYKESMKIAFRIFRPTLADTCTSPAFCMEVFMRLFGRLDTLADALVTPDPLTGTFWFVFGEDAPCKSCEAMVKARDLRERRAIWDKLPEIFGLKPKAPAV
ncbi:hypothetical protein TRAPUB_14067 [Trametes pubescens]|uniref:BTB domain-containing protein n=1 Tax=Trametes pubescens TaxID=154538 RepID=A0A1M2VPD0_TRAPU|nr:hypothetical protein TRAPUB_14067 [Trametes pubescens]